MSLPRKLTQDWRKELLSAMGSTAESPKGEPIIDWYDRFLVCVDCRNEFIYSASEQKSFHQKGFHSPKRCQPCRKAKKERMSKIETDSEKGKFKGLKMPNGRPREKPRYGSPISKPSKGSIRQFG